MNDLFGEDGDRRGRPSCRCRIWHSSARADRQGDFEKRCESVLSPSERESADRFRRVTNRNQHIIGRAMARVLLGGDAVAPQAVTFGVGKHGKPTVEGPPEAAQPFNIAHTDGLVVCGIGSGEIDLVGVDVETLSRQTSPELAERYFSVPEREYLESLDAVSRQSAFLRIWTLKEAFIKAIGTGLHTPLSDFAFREIDSESPTIDFIREGLNDGRTWKFVCFQPRPEFIASVAIATMSPHLEAEIDWRVFDDNLF
ncbi:MAG: 4'-phosphopantetheinyl transferase superfamily protein [Planctomycetota bacterium]